jgi:hypothetical protein
MVKLPYLTNEMNFKTTANCQLRTTNFLLIFFSYYCILINEEVTIKITNHGSDPYF